MHWRVTNWLWALALGAALCLTLGTAHAAAPLETPVGEPEEYTEQPAPQRPIPPEWTAGENPQLLTPSAGTSKPITPSAPLAAQPNPPVTLRNEFIKLVVSNGPMEEGRFAVETTGGNPESPHDNDQPLLYGRPFPWTSFTTVRIDGQDWVFGGPTRRRAGRDGATGQRVQRPTPQGPSKEREIVTTYQLGPILVTQRLSFIRSATTRMKDTALIQYDLTNKGGEPHTVGLRLLLDSLLGTNDGAPFRAAAQAITTETILSGSAVPDFWQAFDKLQEPKVIIEGRLRDEHLTTPDWIAVSNWGTLADHTWSFTPTPGRSFQRAGEQEMDSALALYYDPAPLAAGETRTVVTQVGVGGITTAPGELSLGLTAKSEAAWHPKNPQVIPVVAYLENTGGFVARDVRIRLNTSEGLNIRTARPISPQNLSPSATVSAYWQVVPNGTSFAPQWIEATVTSDNFEENKVRRAVTILDPPGVRTTLKGPERLVLGPNNRYENNPFVATLTVENPTVWTLNDVTVQATSGVGLSLTKYEKPDRLIKTLLPGTSETLDFHLEATGRQYGNLAYSFALSARDVEVTVQRAEIDVPPQQPKLLIVPPQAGVEKDAYAFFDVTLEGMRGMTGADLVVTWDPATVRFVRESEGTLTFYKNAKVSGGVDKDETGATYRVDTSAFPFTGQDSVTKLHFKVLSHNPVICVYGELTGPDSKAIRPVNLAADGKACYQKP